MQTILSNKDVLELSVEMKLDEHNEFLFTTEFRLMLMREFNSEPGDTLPLEATFTQDGLKVVCSNINWASDAELEDGWLIYTATDFTTNISHLDRRNMVITI